jgi:hypothetical protein
MRSACTTRQWQASYWCLRAFGPGGTCDGEPCWQAKGDSGFKFGDKAATQGGIKKITLKSGASGKAKIVVKGQGVGLALCDLPASTPVTAQLHVYDGDRVDCWETSFSASIKNDGEIFKAKGDEPTHPVAGIHRRITKARKYEITTFRTSYSF